MFVSEAMAQSAQQPVSATTIFSFGTLDIPLRPVLIQLWKETQRGMKGFKPTGFNLKWTYGKINPKPTPVVNSNTHQQTERLLFQPWRFSFPFLSLTHLI